MIKIEQLTKSYKKQVVLNEVTLDIPPHTSIALIGPNGCGKTTLIKIILGLVLPDKGAVFFDGKDVTRSFAYRHQIGYMPQIGRYPQHLTVQDIINIVKKMRGTQQTEDELFEKFKIGGFINKRMDALSGGMTQKVSAYLAFMHDVDVYILDEPSAGLDPLSVEILHDKILQEISKKKILLMTSHLLNEMNDLITHVIYMQDNKVKFYESLDNLYHITGKRSINSIITEMLKKECHG